MFEVKIIDDDNPPVYLRWDRGKLTSVDGSVEEFTLEGLMIDHLKQMADVGQPVCIPAGQCWEGSAAIFKNPLATFLLINRCFDHVEITKGTVPPPPYTPGVIH